MRPSTLAAFILALATLAEIWSMMRSTPLPPVAASTASGQVGSLESMARSAPNSPSRARRAAFAALLGDLQPHQPDAGAGALDQDGLARRQPAIGDQRVMHRLQRDRQCRRLLETHVVGRYPADAPPIGDGVFGIAAAARAHDAVALLQPRRHLGAELDHLARPFEADDCAGAAEIAVLVAGRHAEFGTVESGGAHADENLVRLRPRRR